MTKRARLAKAARRRKPRGWDLDAVFARIGSHYAAFGTAAVGGFADALRHGFCDAPRSACHHCLSKSGRLADVHAAYHRRRKARTRRNR